MSLSALNSATQLDTSLYTSITSSITDASPPAAKPPAIESGTPTQLAKDLSALLTELAAGDLEASKADMAKVKQDLESGQDGGTTSRSSDNSPIGKLVSSVSESLNKSDTSDGLTALTSFLVSNGQGTGTLLSTSA